MPLRRLEIKDVELMLEWMKDPDLNVFFRFDSNQITHETMISYIEQSWIDDKNKHFAIVNDNDEYMGTISLKNIDVYNKNAEYAVSLRKKAIGTGIAKKATADLLIIAFNNMLLDKVYLNVLSTNTRAIRFYEKFGFTYEGEFSHHLLIKNEWYNLKWYAIFRSVKNEWC